MNKVDFKLDTNAFRKEVLQADWMKSFIEKEAKKMDDQNGQVKSYVGIDRVRAVVYPRTKGKSE